MLTRAWNVLMKSLPLGLKQWKSFDFTHSNGSVIIIVCVIYVWYESDIPEGHSVDMCATASAAAAAGGRETIEDFRIWIKFMCINRPKIGTNHQQLSLWFFDSYRSTSTQNLHAHVRTLTHDLSIYWFPEKVFFFHLHHLAFIHRFYILSDIFPLKRPFVEWNTLRAQMETFDCTRMSICRYIKWYEWFFGQFAFICYSFVIRRNTDNILMRVKACI